MAWHIDKWIRYRIGKPIAGCKIIPIKTPLGPQFNNEVPPEHRMGPERLVNMYKEKYGIVIGLIVDLSNSEVKYTVPPTIELTYVKLRAVAKVIPPLESVDEFINLVSSYLSNNPNNYVAVHCQYGYNRTGYMICNYLMRNLGWTADAALRAFAASKPPGIRHEHFRKALYAEEKRLASLRSASPSSPGSSSSSFSPAFSSFSQTTPSSFHLPPAEISSPATKKSSLSSVLTSSSPSTAPTSTSSTTATHSLPDSARSGETTSSSAGGHEQNNDSAQARIAVLCDGV